jgi:succinate dehydrogenase hydrophobic anchor subunit
MVLHYPPFHIDFSRILERMADPLWKAIDIAFLFFVLMHALAGIHAVVTDFDAASRWHKLHAAVMAAIGIAAFLYGTATILAFQPPV